MRDFPSCFGESGVQIADSSTSRSGAQNLVTCLYHSQLSRRSCVISVSWSRTLMGQGFSIGVDDDSGCRCLCKLDIKPWLFSKRKGSKSVDVDGSKVDVFWDLSNAKFPANAAAAEPLEGYYVAVVVDLEMALLLGDLRKDAYRKTGAIPPPADSVFVARKEHVYGKKVFRANAQFHDDGQCHDVAIECDIVGVKDPCLEIRVDRKLVLQVKRLAWKFRGNQTIVVEGSPVELFWDVHSWLFGAPTGCAVFMFQTCQPSDKSSSSPPWSSSPPPPPQGVGFSLVLYAWKCE